MKRRPVHVYFFSAPGRIKIGISKDVAGRLGSVGSHMETKPELIGSIHGDRHFEKHLHRLLAHQRLKGEWFNDCPEVREVADKVLKGETLGFVPPVPAPRPIPTEKTPEEWLAMFNRVVSLVWPGDPAAGLADFLEMPRETVSDYLTGKVDVPKIVAHAFASHLVRWIHEETLRLNEAA